VLEDEPDEQDDGDDCDCEQHEDPDLAGSMSHRAYGVAALPERMLQLALDVGVDPPLEA
jgi:hypothetical protein